MRACLRRVEEADVVDEALAESDGFERSLVRSARVMDVRALVRLLLLVMLRARKVKGQWGRW